MDLVYFWAVQYCYTKPRHHSYNVDTGVLEDLNESEISRLLVMGNNLEIAGLRTILTRYRDYYVILNSDTNS